MRVLFKHLAGAIWLGPAALAASLLAGCASLASQPAPVVEPPPPPPPPPTRTCLDGSIILATEPCPAAPTANGHGGDAEAPPPPPPPPPEPERDGEEWEDGRPSPPGGRPYGPTASISRETSLPGLYQRRYSLASVRYWQTSNGALGGQALIAILEQCVADFGGVGPECLAAVGAGNNDFSVVPASARSEFAQIYRSSCQAGRSEAACVAQLQKTSAFRALPRGGLTLGPNVMHEKVRTLFTAQIRDSGAVEGRAGLPTSVGFEPDPERPGEERRIEVVPFSLEMCFVLTPDDPALASVEAQPGEGRKVGPPNRVCMTANDGIGASKFDPSWWVTPLTGQDFGLKLDLEHYVGAMKQTYPQEPRPIPIDVIPAKTAWEKLDAWLAQATGTANLATKLATAIGALIAAVMAWKIWATTKRRRGGRRAR
jgi:hypothetical protein